MKRTLNNADLLSKIYVNERTYFESTLSENNGRKTGQNKNFTERNGEMKLPRLSLLPRCETQLERHNEDLLQIACQVYPMPYIHCCPFQKAMSSNLILWRCGKRMQVNNQSNCAFYYIFAFFYALSDCCSDFNQNSWYKRTMHCIFYGAAIDKYTISQTATFSLRQQTIFQIISNTIESQPLSSRLLRGIIQSMVYSLALVPAKSTQCPCNNS